MSPHPLIVEQDGGVLTLTNSDAPRNRMSLEGDPPEVHP
jgi:hypothetical protein